MIFVTVGTHEQQFDRLIEYIDKLKENKIINEEVIIQTGFSTYKPQYCKWQKLFTYQEMKKLVDDARIVITHGGPSSFIMPLQVGKIPIVVPRQFEYNEHVNNHQVSFTKAVEERMGTIIVIENVNDLRNCIENYDTFIEDKSNSIHSNNIRFNSNLNKIVNDMFKREKDGV